MPKFKVEVDVERRGTTTVTVEADNEDDAAVLAEEEAGGMSGSDIDWWEESFFAGEITRVEEA